MRVDFQRRQRKTTGAGPGPERPDHQHTESMNVRTSIYIAVLLAASSLTAVAQESNGLEKLDFDSFNIVSLKNIFDPTRSGRRTTVRSTPAIRIERISLAGTTVGPG